MAVICYECMQEFPGELRICPNCNARIPYQIKDARDCPPGTLLNRRYLIGKAIGHGGFGVTYIAFDVKTNKKVCVKESNTANGTYRDPKNPVMLLPKEDEESKKNFIKYRDALFHEAHLLSTLRDLPDVVHCIDSFNANNTAYMVMEYLEGRDLKHFVLKERSRDMLSIEEAVFYTIRVLMTLSKVHKRMILHRDISPDNIFLTNNGGIMLIDFGSAQHVNATDMERFKKRGYMYPEMSEGGKEGFYSDLFSVGAVMFFLLTGRSPFADTNTPSLPPERSTPQLSAIFTKATQHDGRMRYQSADEMIADLQAVLASMNLQPVPEANADRPRKKNSTKLVVGLLSASLIVLLGVIIRFGTSSSPTTAQPISPRNVTSHQHGTSESGPTGTKRPADVTVPTASAARKAPATATPVVVTAAPATATPKIVTKAPVTATPRVVTKAPVTATPRIVTKAPVTATPRIVTKAPVTATPTAVPVTPTASKAVQSPSAPPVAVTLAPRLSVSRVFDNGIEVDKTGHRGVSITVFSNTSWQAKVTEGADWIDVSAASGVGNGSFYAAIAVNNGAERQGLIELNAPACERITIRVTQASAFEYTAPSVQGITEAFANEENTYTVHADGAVRYVEYLNGKRTAEFEAADTPTKIPLTFTQSGRYMLQFTAVYPDGTESEKSERLIINVAEKVEIIPVAPSLQGATEVYSYTENTYTVHADGAVRYVEYLNGKKMTEFEADDQPTSILLTFTQSGRYMLQFTAVYPDGTESEKSERLIINVAEKAAITPVAPSLQGATEVYSYTENTYTVHADGAVRYVEYLNGKKMTEFEADDQPTSILLTFTQSGRYLLQFTAVYPDGTESEKSERLIVNVAEKAAITPVAPSLQGATEVFCNEQSSYTVHADGAVSYIQYLNGKRTAEFEATDTPTSIPLTFTQSGRYLLQFTAVYPDGTESDMSKRLIVNVKSPDR